MLPQTFALPASACIGQYLRVNLIGKRQRQQTDMRFYTAIWAVTAHGPRAACAAAGALALAPAGAAAHAAAPGEASPLAKHNVCMWHAARISALADMKFAPAALAPLAHAAA